jgi:two-component system, OmpR family, sensor kinase
MTPIAAWVELLLTQVRRHSSTIPPEILSGLERLEYLVDAYLRRATTLLDVSRISTGNLQLTPAEIDLSSLVRETVSAMVPAAETAECAIHLAVQEGVSGSFDRIALEQVIENIVSNAIRYGAGQPINIAFTTDGNTIQLAVSDRGIGISESDQARIFEQFQRVSGGNTSGGFGVGLFPSGVGRLSIMGGGERRCDYRMQRGEGKCPQTRLWAQTSGGDTERGRSL